jgi:hypothetical protein
VETKAMSFNEKINQPMHLKQGNNGTNGLRESLALGFEEKIVHVAFMHCNMCQWFEEKCAHMTFMDWDTC